MRVERLDTIALLLEGFEQLVADLTWWMEENGGGEVGDVDERMMDSGIEKERVNISPHDIGILRCTRELISVKQSDDRLWGAFL